LIGITLLESSNNLKTKKSTHSRSL